MSSHSLPIDAAVIARENDARQVAHDRDYAALREQLARRGVDIDTITAAVGRLAVAIPSWGVGTGGTRFARFPGPGEPRNVFEKLADCAVIQQLGRATPAVSLHLPWDATSDYRGLREHAAALGLGFAPVNSNTFQDRAGQHSYKFGSLTHVSAETRAQAIEHNIDCIRIGEQLGARALTVWIGDGSNFPGQQDFTAAFERYLDSTRQIYAALPQGWTMLLEHKLFEPAFYATVLQDWGSSYFAASQLGPAARCLVDLGHHAPTVNIELIVARLGQAGKLGGFHFNDSKYGDDDLDSGSINPFQLFLVFHELVGLARRNPTAADPEYMLDQSHNVTDPIESLINSAGQILGAQARALLVDRDALGGYQQANDVLMAHRALKSAYETDVRPILAEVRRRAGGALEPIETYRAAGYRQRVARDRGETGSNSAGIV
jgi:L-rhamnose isomerase/sugar isomerase